MGANLKNILCEYKDKLIPNSFPGAYELKCSRGPVYIGEKKRKSLVDQ